MAARYAIYFAPAPESRLENLGAWWLGRNPRTGQTLSGPEQLAFPANRLDALRASPRRYGFHGTLKAPFRLAADADETALIDAAASFAATQHRFFMSPLAVGALAGFAALVPGERECRLHELADACVRHFDPLRAPLNQEEFRRRRPERLTPRQRDHLAEWGYPHVFEDFRFHMTLTGRTEADELSILLPFLDQLFRPVLAMPLEFDAISVFRQSETGQDFHILARFELANAQALAG